jgi:hypothetical protein
MLSVRRRKATAILAVRHGGKLKCLERDDRPRVLDARNCLDLLVHEMADVGSLLDVELHEQVKVARSRIDFGCDFGVGQRVCDFIGPTELAFDLDEERNHVASGQERLRRNPAKMRSIDKGLIEYAFGGKLGRVGGDRGNAFYSARFPQ